MDDGWMCKWLIWLEKEAGAGMKMRDDGRWRRERNGARCAGRG